MSTPAGTTCTNEVWGFTVTIPDGWFDYGGTAGQRCRFMDVVAPPTSAEGELPNTAIGIFALDAAYQDWADSYGNNSGIDLISSSDVTIRGRPGVRMEFAFTDDPNPGATTYTYVIDQAGTAFVIAAYSLASTDFEATRAIVDQLAASLEFLT